MVSLRSWRRVATSWTMALSSSGGKVGEDMVLGRGMKLLRFDEAESLKP
jgi:hypothetical protein